MFAYPFGVYSQRAEDALAAAGYSWAFAADDKVRQVSFDDPSLDHMAVPRTITYRYTAQGPAQDAEEDSWTTTARPSSRTPPPAADRGAAPRRRRRQVDAPYRDRAPREAEAAQPLAQEEEGRPTDTTGTRFRKTLVVPAPRLSMAAM